jgi:prevent-host-death family protein
MKTVSIREAKNRLTELARAVENGETLTVTRHGKPIFDIVPHKPRGGLNFEAGRIFREKLGIGTFFTDIAPDFDEPLPDAFWLGENEKT